VGHGRGIRLETQQERSLRAQTGAPLLATVHVLPLCPSRAGLRCLVLLRGWVLVVPSWAHSAQVPAPAGRFRLGHDIEEVVLQIWT
jgi:hypothetical protein